MRAPRLSVGRIGFRQLVMILLLLTLTVSGCKANPSSITNPSATQASSSSGPAENFNASSEPVSAAEPESRQSSYPSTSTVSSAKPTPETTRSLQPTQLEVIKPNLIVVLNESFWDPTLIRSIRFSQDPIPTFHRLSEQYSGGYMLSPQYGGITANVEFEVLTGLSRRFFSEWTIAYETLVKRDIDSLAGILRRQGYTSTAISPYHSWFANSREVYRRFGFGRFIPMEFFPPDYEGPYLADRAVASKIIEESSASAGPDFIYANTMENHYHYRKMKFEKNTIDVEPIEGAAISELSEELLETYAQGLLDADRMLQTLVEHYQKSDEPTIVVFFGDHMPYFEPDYYAYLNTGYLSKDDPDELNKMHNVPLLIWDNYLPREREELHISPSFLSSYLLDKARLSGTPFTRYLSALSRRMPLFPPEEAYERYGISESDVREYEAIQSDILEGPQTIYGADTISISDPSYRVGNRELYIDKVRGLSSDPKQETEAFLQKPINGDLPIKITGGRYGLGCRIAVNGKPLPTTWESETVLTSVIPRKLLDATKGTIRIDVRVVDSKQTVLARSEEMLLQLEETQAESVNSATTE
jgi:hypothetical protein